MQVLEHVKITAPSCNIACQCIPRAALAPEPPQYLQVTTFAGTGKDQSIQLVALLSFQPPQGFHLASARCEEDKERRKSEPRTQRNVGKRLTCIPGDLFAEPSL